MKLAALSLRVVCLLSLAVSGCGAPEQEPSAAPAASVESDYRCEPLSAEALRVAAPPAALVLGPSASAVTPSAARLCPTGQVPRATRNPEPPHHRAPMLAANVPGDRPVSASADAYYYAGVMKPTSATGFPLGVGALIQIADPAVANWGDQVTAETAIVQGANTSLVEVGYRKWQTTYPTLLLGNWVGGVFKHVTGWVQTHSSYYPGMNLSAYVGAKVRFYIVYAGGNWWVWFNDGWMGYFPSSLWGGSFTSGDMAHWYGEVFDYGARVPPITDMGNGLFGSNPAASAIDEMCTHSGTNCFLMSGASTSVTNATYYDLYYPGGSSLRYGGNGGG
ncbi:neprosin family prolyl endopeptidase [Corallococcus exercitus]|uniref:Neprosin family prolyl endopeptidase n=1 Tax=Corallococcus exercitus TaxID=2316736 RepID=A0A7Y4NQM4_9BACT|nr:neprosin family prolyl endopeptidase [Corallococcus exercitus]NOK33579.1 neprosin family prolyl endopeptidase [Corallococcus exercitus]